MRPMAARRLALLLLLYVSLDVANPLMPGAVQFVDGSVEVIQADRARPESLAAPAPLVRLPALERPQVAVQTLPSSRPMTVDSRQALLPVRRPADASSGPPSPSEDH